MAKNVITIRHSILIEKPRELVWEYTQNYENRTAWDSSVIEAKVIQTSPNRMVKVKSKGNTTMTFVYKVDNCPTKSTLAAKDIISSIIEGAGGSWTYEQFENQTLWTQTNTIVFKNHFISKLLLPFYKLLFDSLTKKAMKKAKQQLESK